MNMEMYRSGRNENDSKSNWLFGSGFPVLLGFMRVFRLREGTIFWRSLLQFSPKFSQNARRILKFNIWSITQVVVRGRTRNAIGRETGARVRLPDAPPKTPQDDEFCGVFHCIFYFPASNTASTAFWTCSLFSASVKISSAGASKTAVGFLPTFQHSQVKKLVQHSNSIREKPSRDCTKQVQYDLAFAG